VAIGTVWGSSVRRKDIVQKLAAMEMKMQMIMAILSISLLMLVDEASAQSTYSASVSRHASVPPLSEAQVRKILDDASKALQKNSVSNGDTDVACNVTFSMKGPVRTFGSAGTSTNIVDEQHRDAVHKVDSDVAGVDFHVKVVKEIMFCRPGLAETFFAGCSFPPDFRSIIVVHPSEHRDVMPRHAKYPDHLLWAHEFGHLTGLGHRHSSSALMTSCPVAKLLSVTRVQVNNEECRCLLGGPGSCPLPGALNCQPQ
jgi:hypothetical protein